MSISLPGSSDEHEHGRHSPVDLPYFNNARSPSGGHLIPPVAGTNHSRDWIAVGSLTSLHEDPSEIRHDTPHAVLDPILLSSSCPTVHSHRDDHTPNPDTQAHSSHSPGSQHCAISVAPETPPETPADKASPRISHLLFDINNLESHQSRTSLAMKSSARSVSQTSQRSTGRASYREHHGSPARVRTLATSQHAFSDPLSSPVLTTAKPGCITAPPSTDNPNQHGSPNVGPRFLPMSVAGVLRYERKTRKKSELDCKIAAMTYQYPETVGKVPEGWIAYRHPEGGLYFLHGGLRKTFTEVNICDEDICEDIEYFRGFLFSELEAEIKKRSLSESLRANEVQLVLEPKVDNLGVFCCYYFVNPAARSLFWLDEWEGYEIFKDCEGALSYPHKGLAVQSHYWFVICSAVYQASHWDLYPNFCEVTQELKNELVDMILHATCDHLTSNTSSCPLHPEELAKYLSLIERIDPEKIGNRKHSAIVIGRTMHIFYHNYFLNFHGEECARLNFHQTVHGWRYRPSLSLSIFAPLLFMAPISNVRLLHRIFVDGIASKDKWNSFVTRLNSQLQETSVLATVLLNANVAFLPKESGTGTSPQQFLSYSSLVASIASIILGLVFMDHSRTEARNTPFQAAKFLNGLWHEKHGLERLAIIYSLPHAFLMWGMCLFFAAFATQWYYAGDTGIRTGAAVVMFIVALLVAWCIWTARDRSNFWWFQPDPSQVECEEDEADNTMPSTSKDKIDPNIGFRSLQDLCRTDRGVIKQDFFG